MSAGYSVILEDLQNAALKFVAQATTFYHISNESTTLHSPDTGEGTLNQALADALQRFSLVAEEFSQKILLNGCNLQDAHDNYKQTDADVARLLDKLMTDSGSAE